MNMSRLSVPQAAERLRVSPARVRQRIDDGSLVAEKIGGRWLVDLDASSSAPVRLGRPVSPSSVWWSLASAEVAKAVLPRSAVSVVNSDLQQALKPIVDAVVASKFAMPAVDVSIRESLLPAADASAIRKAVVPAIDMSSIQAAIKPAVDSAALRRSLLPRMRLAELVLADLSEAAESSGRSPESSSVRSHAEHPDEPDPVSPEFVAEAKKLSRSSRNRAVHRLAGAVQERDHDELLAWLKNRAARRLYVAAAADLASLPQDGRLILSGVSHPSSNLDDPRVVEAYVSDKDLVGLVNDYWLERPGVDERPNVVLHVAPVRPPEVGPMLLAADLAEHGGSREVQRAHELLDVAIEALVSSDEGQGRQ